MGDGDRPIKNKSELVDALWIPIGEAVDFCKERGVDLDAILNTECLPLKMMKVQRRNDVGWLTLPDS